MFVVQSALDGGQVILHMRVIHAMTAATCGLVSSHMRPLFYAELGGMYICFRQVPLCFVGFRFFLYLTKCVHNVYCVLFSFRYQFLMLFCKITFAITRTLLHLLKSMLYFYYVV